MAKKIICRWVSVLRCRFWFEFIGPAIKYKLYYKHFLHLYGNWLALAGRPVRLHDRVQYSLKDGNRRKVVSLNKCSMLNVQQTM
ncbi:MAG: hypothetical protein J7502_12960, partial [Flavisolibacter sp.]|nr:hypothetical protein [Flavisolibacter sp.]